MRHCDSPDITSVQDDEAPGQLGLSYWKSRIACTVTCRPLIVVRLWSKASQGIVRVGRQGTVGLARGVLHGLWNQRECAGDVNEILFDDPIRVCHAEVGAGNSSSSMLSKIRGIAWRPQTMRCSARIVARMPVIDDQYPDKLVSSREPYPGTSRSRRRGNG